MCMHDTQQPVQVRTTWLIAVYDRPTKTSKSIMQKEKK